MLPAKHVLDWILIAYPVIQLKIDTSLIIPVHVWLAIMIVDRIVWNVIKLVVVAQGQIRMIAQYVQHI